MGQSSTKFKKVSHDKADLRLRCLNLVAVGAKKGVYKERYESFADLQHALRSGPSKQMLASKYFANILKALVAGDDLCVVEGSDSELHQPGTWRQPAHLPPVDDMLKAIRAVKIPAAERKRWKTEVKGRKRQEREDAKARAREAREAEAEERKKTEL